MQLARNVRRGRRNDERPLLVDLAPVEVARIEAGEDVRLGVEVRVLGGGGGGDGGDEVGAGAPPRVPVALDVGGVVASCHGVCEICGLERASVCGVRC